MYKTIFRPIFFLFDPEKIHKVVTGLMKLSGYIPGIPALLRSAYGYKNVSLEREYFGIRFDNPIGLAAGFDKDAEFIDELANFGFGFVEIGTLTPKPQPGNPKPRMFRLPEDKAIINRMGFNNKGVENAVPRLKKRKSRIIVGGNIGKNKITQNQFALRDYESCIDALHPVVDYFVVNVSSPNTPELRNLQEKEPLLELLTAVKKKSLEQEVYKPVLLKIAPDLSEQELDDIIEIIKTTKIDGIIATNTTVDRNGLSAFSSKVEAIGAGGLSGLPLKTRSNEVIRYLRKKLGKKYPIIGVGGVFTANDAIDKLKAGASLVQVYSGFIYEGPGMIKRIKKAIAKANL